MSTLISADQTWALWAVLLFVAALGLWLEITRWGARVSAPVITLAVGFGLANSGVIPASGPTYDTIWNYLAPMAIPLLLFQVNLKRTPKAFLFTGIAFGIAIVGILFGAVIAEFLVLANSKGWQLAGSFVAGFIGDTDSYSNTARALHLGPSRLRAAGLATERVVMMLYLVILFVLPSIYWLRERFTEPAWEGRHWHATAAVVHEAAERGVRIYVPALAAALAISAVLCAAGFALEKKVGVAGSAIIFISLASALLSLTLRKQIDKLNGARELGQLIVHLLFATIGAAALLPVIVNTSPMLLVFAVTIVATHLGLLLLIGKLVGISLPALLIASNAAIGGPYTAAAMAGARRWDHFLLPAIIFAAAGSMFAEFIGATLALALH